MNDETQLIKDEKVSETQLNFEDKYSQESKTISINLSNILTATEKIGETIQTIALKGTQVYNTFEKAGKVFREFYKKLDILFQNIGEIATNISNLHQDIKVVSDEISRKGWFIPLDFSLSIPQVAQLKDLKVDELDEFFLQYYTKNNQELMNNLFSRIQEKIECGKISSRYRQIFQECVESYLEGKYIIAVVALCPIVEGILYDVFYDVEQQSADKGEMLKAMDSKIKQSNWLFKVTYVSVYKFVKNTLKYADFSKPEPEIGLNRHWILHGKSGYEFKQIDAIKLFALIDTIIIFQER